jgi:hypothetical protein
MARDTLLPRRPALEKFSIIVNTILGELSNVSSNQSAAFALIPIF